MNLMSRLLVNLLSSLWKLTKRFRIEILLIVLLLPSVSSLLQPGYFSMHDDLQVFRLFELNKCFQDGQIPCRWVPDGGFGYGYPLMQFYPPMPYYPMELMVMLGLGFFWPVKIMFILAFIFSGLGMYYLAKEFFGKWGGILSALFYVYAPYHSVDIYVRGAQNEAWGMVWFPLTFYAAYQIIATKKTLRYTAMLAFAFAGLLTSHNVMTLIFSPLLGLWSLYWVWANKDIKKIVSLALAAVWGVALSAFFFIPVTLEKSQVHVESMTVGYFNYMAHFVDINQMFFSRFWGYGGSIWGPDDDMAFPLGHFHWIIAALVGIISAVIVIRSIRSIRIIRNSFAPVALLLLLFTGIYILLMHPRSIWFWDHLPLLYYAQFPWRLLAIPTFIFSFLSAYFVFLFFHISKIPRLICSLFTVSLITGVILWNLPFFKIEKPVDITLEEKLSGALWELQTTGGIFDYLPRAASRPPGSPAFHFPEFIKGTGDITDYQKQPAALSFTAQVISPSALIRLPVFAYPDWQVRVDGKKIPYSFDADLGRIELSVPEGNHTIVARYQDTRVRSLANLFSLITFAASAIFLFKRRHHI